MHMQRQGCLFLYNICVHGALLLLFCTTYDLLHVLHCSQYIPLEFVLFCGVRSCSWLYMVLYLQNAMFMLVSLNRLETLCVSELWYVNVIHFSLCVCVGVFSVFCVLIILFFKLGILYNGKPIFLAMVQVVSLSCCLAGTKWELPEDDTLVLKHIGAINKEQYNKLSIKCAFVYSLRKWNYSPNPISRMKDLDWWNNLWYKHPVLNYVFNKPVNTVHTPGLCRSYSTFKLATFGGSSSTIYEQFWRGLQDYYSILYFENCKMWKTTIAKAFSGYSLYITVWCTFPTCYYYVVVFLKCNEGSIPIHSPHVPYSIDFSMQVLPSKHYRFTTVHSYDRDNNQ